MLDTINIFLALSLFLTVKTEESGTFFTIEDNHFLLSENVIWRIRGQSLFSCSRLCARRLDCKGANFLRKKATCLLLSKQQTELLDMTQERQGYFYLKKLDVGGPKEGPTIGTTQSTAIHSSCKAILDHDHFTSSGVYQIDLDGGTHDNAFRVYCDMDTDGGGWTLVWSYTFTDYDDFDYDSNAVTPRPNWWANSKVDVSVSTTPPLSETDYNAVNFSMWKQLGKQVLIKSNINNWLICHPGTGSLVDWKAGDVSCHVIKNVTSTCQGTLAPTDVMTGDSYNHYGPMYYSSGIKSGIYYYFDGSKSDNWPTHDPCGLNKENNLSDVKDPHGNIFIR